VRVPRRLARLSLTVLTAFALLMLALAGTAGASLGCAGGRTVCARSASLGSAALEDEEAEVEGEGEEAEVGEGDSEDLSAAEESEEEGEEAEEEDEEGTGRRKRSRSVTLSDLKLTSSGSSALKHHGPSVSSVGFSFTSSAAAKVRVTLFKQTTVHGHSHWTAIPGSITLEAGKGSSHRNFSGHARLASGRYMLTAQPSAGRSSSIFLSTHG
jgi:hypothetical protein